MREPDDAVRFTPAMYLDHLRRQRAARGLAAHLEDFGIAPLVVGTWFHSMTMALVRETGAKPAENWPHRIPAAPCLFTGEAGGKRVSFATLAMGAPGTVLELEDLIAAGARRVVGLGLAGSLQETAPVGTALLPGECVREEGTSQHYLPPQVKVGPDPGLRAVLARAAGKGGLAVCQGRHWTTDAIYREFVWKIEKYRSEGILGVDMETSAMYALGDFRGVAVANLLVVSDELWREWRPAFGSEELRRATDLSVRAVLESLPELAGTEDVRTGAVAAGARMRPAASEAGEKAGEEVSDVLPEA